VMRLSDRDRRRRIGWCLHQRHQRSFAAGKVGRPPDGTELFVQRRKGCFARGAMRGDPKAVAAGNLRQIMRRTDAVGDVKKSTS